MADLVLRCGACLRVRHLKGGPCWACGAHTFEAAREKYRSIGGAPPLERLPFGDSLFARVLGGYVRGLRALVYGPPSAGKTSLAVLAAAEFLQRGHDVAWLSREMSAGHLEEYAKRLGVELSEACFFSDEGEALDAAEELDCFFVVDSVGLFSARVFGVKSAFSCLIAREVKSGDLAGTVNQQYDVDAIVHVSGGMALLEKSRWCRPHSMALEWA